MRLAVLAFALSIVSIVGAAAEGLDSKAWREDLAFLVEQIRSVHLKPFHSVSETEFDATVERLHAEIPDLSDAAIALEMDRLMALIGDGHTWISYGKTSFVRKYPILLYWFDDGLFVTHAMKGYEELVGARVVKVGNALIEEVLQAADPFVSRDNEWTVRGNVANLPATAEFLRHAGFVENMEQVVYTFEDGDGKTFEKTLSPISMNDFSAWTASIEPLENPPMYLSNTEPAYWMKHMKDQKAVYMQFNAVSNLEDGPHLARFARDLIELIDETKSKYLIVDVRHNGGGNGDMLKPLIRRISESKRVNREGRLFVLTSRQTFSAALMFIMRMERETEALFAGEPSGGKPNSYGEFNPFELPNSKLYGSISSRYHEEGEPGDMREFLSVDITAPLTSGAYFANRDPVLEAVFEYIRKR